ncbi:MAG: PAC2 family protein [Bifidobacteriaceae bacterium]|nr:PAC2 family protein [Bifidobacteriaceae bacterium]
MFNAIAAFAGWNDAGAAATDAVRRLVKALDASPAGSISPQGYCDLQVNRPLVRLNKQGLREIVWPETEIFRAQAPGGGELVLVVGVEPSFRWIDFADDLLTRITELGVDRLWLAGALLADMPHTRPFPVQTGSTSPALVEQFEAEKPLYEGPAGIVAVLGHQAEHRYKLESGSLWVPVPHYVGNPPSPKAELALVARMAEVLGLEGLDTAELAEEARAWTEGVEALASGDPEVAGYVSALEEAADELASTKGSGEALAKEFERYLRRHGS